MLFLLNLSEEETAWKYNSVVIGVYLIPSNDQQCKTDYQCLALFLLKTHRANKFFSFIGPTGNISGCTCFVKDNILRVLTIVHAAVLFLCFSVCRYVLYTAC